MRRTRKSLHARAHRHATSWETPTFSLSRKDADARVRGAWLAGYKAAQRDARRTVRVSDLVNVTVGPLSLDHALEEPGAHTRRVASGRVMTAYGAGEYVHPTNCSCEFCRLPGVLHDAPPSNL